MVNEWLIVMISLIICQRMAELHIAERNRRILLQEGAQEFGNSHYPLFFVLHIGWLVGLIAETLFWGKLVDYWAVYLGLFIISQGLRYWSISSLGKFWNTRILMVPSQPLIQQGPYRFVRHPNYLAVALELFSVPLIFGAVITAIVSTVLNMGLLFGLRIPAEEKALGLNRANE